MHFNTIWTPKETYERESSKFQQEIILAERQRVPFPLTCRKCDGAWGIWVFINQTWLLISPIDLVSSLYADGEGYITLKDNNGVEYNITITKSEYTFIWRIMCAEKSYYEELHYRFMHYFMRIQNRIKHLCDMVRDGHSTADRMVKLDHLEVCCKQLEIEALQPSAYNVDASKIIIEQFVFMPCRRDDRYEIGIGNRTYETVMTDWDNNYNKIRHQFECLVYSDKTDIELTFDSSDTVIRIERVSVVDGIEKREHGYAYSYKEFALVKIIPNGFVWYPIIAGYCDYKETIRALYEGLLSFALNQSSEKQSHSDISLRMDMYNAFKSPLIERYIKKMHLERKPVVKHILQIYPDYDSLGEDLTTGYNITIYDSGELDETFYDKKGEKIIMPELAKWQREIHPIVIASETNQPYDKDWADYHRRGLELARQLRELLSDECDLWYAAPVEDKSGTIKGSILIL